MKLTFQKINERHLIHFTINALFTILILKALNCFKFYNL